MRLLRPGDPVVLISSGECGIVLWTWPCEHAEHIPDHYVAFFGKSFPWGKPRRVPYVLRYAATSLQAVVTEEVGGRVHWRVPIYAAVEDNDLKAIRFLLREGVEQASLNGALRRAVVHHGNLTVIRLLLRHGADVNAVDHDGATVLFKAVYNPKANPRVVTALIKAGARVNDLMDLNFIAPPPWNRDRRRTALHYAASVAPLAVVNLLIKKGANVNVADKKGITPLMVATTHGRTEVVKVLLRAGAAPSAKDRKGRTALEWAKQSMDSPAPGIRRGAREVATMLRSRATSARKVGSKR